MNPPWTYANSNNNNKKTQKKIIAHTTKKQTKKSTFLDYRFNRFNRFRL
jgi:hypothetical protein